MLAAAIEMLALGWSVIAIEPHQKRPAVAWRDYQSRHATAAELRGWFDAWPDANLGLVTGAISGVTVLDVESDGLWALDEEHVPMTVTSASQGGGRHFFFVHEPSHRTTTWTVMGQHVGDVRADGGVIVLPPSIGPSGVYRWLVDPTNRPVSDAPLWLDHLGRGDTAAGAHRPVFPRSQAIGRSEADCAFAFERLAAGDDPAIIVSEIAAGPAAQDRGRFAREYAERTLRAARRWADDHLCEATIQSVKVLRTRVRFALQTCTGQQMHLDLDRPVTPRSQRRWEALNEALGFDVAATPRAARGRPVMVELLRREGVLRIGRIFPLAGGRAS